MGLDSFTSDSSDDKDEEEQAEHTQGEFPHPEAITRILLHHCRKDSNSIKVEGGKIQGDAREVAMVFALMFIDYPEADPYSLEDPD